MVYQYKTLFYEIKKNLNAENFSIFFLSYMKLPWKLKKKILHKQLLEHFLVDRVFGNETIYTHEYVNIKYLIVYH